MILITAKAMVSEKNRAAYLKLCMEQVKNSKMEDGCLDYGFYEDAMEPGTFLFVEHWKDQAAIDFHFAQHYCLDFIRAVRKLSKAVSPIEIHHVSTSARPT